MPIKKIVFEQFPLSDAVHTRENDDNMNDPNILLNFPRFILSIYP